MRRLECIWLTFLRLTFAPFSYIFWSATCTYGRLVSNLNACSHFAWYSLNVLLIKSAVSASLPFISEPKFAHLEIQAHRKVCECLCNVGTFKYFSRWTGTEEKGGKGRNEKRMRKRIIVPNYVAHNVIWPLKHSRRRRRTSELRCIHSRRAQRVAEFVDSRAVAQMRHIGRLLTLDTNKPLSFSLIYFISCSISFLLSRTWILGSRALSICDKTNTGLFLFLLSFAYSSGVWCCCTSLVDMDAVRPVAYNILIWRILQTNERKFLGRSYFSPLLCRICHLCLSHRPAQTRLDALYVTCLHINSPNVLKWICICCPQNRIDGADSFNLSAELITFPHSEKCDVVHDDDLAV